MKVKCIVYASKAPMGKGGAMVPVGLAEICRVSKKMNTMNKITGILAYSNGRYLQIIEGDEKQVDQLFTNINADKRHTDIELVMGLTNAQRAFRHWNATLIRPINSDPQFRAFIKKYSHFIYRLPKAKRELLTPFVQHVRIGFSNRQLEDKYVSLTKWPDFTQMEQSARVFELCSRLNARPQLYSDLIKSPHLGSQSDIDAHLNEFDNMGILHITHIEPPHMPRLESNGQASTLPQSFYHKMKRFINMV